MLKKLLLVALISFQGLYAFTLIKSQGEPHTLKVNPNLKNEGRTDWIGVYKKGTSTDWNNVIEWKWVTHLFNNTQYYIGHLAPNDYTVRYFKNNSFTVSDEYELHIDKENESKIFLKDHEYLNGSLRIRLKTEGKEKDWVAYYKKGTSTAWENVIKWHWVKDLKCSNPAECHDSLPPEDLAPGDYEVRYFKNNSFTMEGQALSLKIRKVNSTLESITSYSNSKGHLKINFRGLGKYLQPNSKDWIALYKVNDSNAWENVVQWVWAKDITLEIHDKRYNNAYHDMKNIQPGRYEVRYFLNNSFSIYAKSKVIIVK